MQFLLISPSSRDVLSHLKVEKVINVSDWSLGGVQTDEIYLPILSSSSASTASSLIQWKFPAETYLLIWK